jgi:hypothetical protein
MAVRERLAAVAARQRPFPPPDPASEAVKTWRYLRLAMVAVAVGLGASVVYEHLQTAPSCWQPSISAYYYTPVQGFLVGALLTIGVSLVAVQGNTDWEDLLLNLAGICAPVVAFVPHRDPGTCGSVLTTPVNRDLNIANNVTALLVAGGLGLLVVAVLALRGRWNPGAEPLTPTAKFGFGATVALYLGTVVVFLSARRWFVDWGHPVAAIAMFGFILLNVGLNALNWRRQPAGQAPGNLRSPWRTNWYAVVAVLMAAAAVGWALTGLLGHWAYWLLGLESSLIALFAVFWVLQTAELWDRGLRPAPAPVPREAPVRV